MVRQFLDNLRKTAVGPDDIPYWFWRNFSSELAPVITIIFNRSLTEGIVPDMWKKILPVPKESPLETCNQLRPISLTAVIMRLFERIVVVVVVVVVIIKGPSKGYKEQIK